MTRSGGSHNQADAREIRDLGQQAQAQSRGFRPDGNPGDRFDDQDRGQKPSSGEPPPAGAKSLAADAN